MKILNSPSCIIVFALLCTLGALYGARGFFISENQGLIDFNSSICTSAGVKSAPLLGNIDRRLTAAIPEANPADPTLTAETYSVKKGAIIEYEVTSTRAGEITVHGLLEPQALVVGSVTKVVFRAFYSGRFPLHFHGTDGSHFAVSEIHVMP